MRNTDNGNDQEHENTEALGGRGDSEDAGDAVPLPEIDEPLRQRVQTLLGEISLNQAAKAIGVPPPSLQHWLNRARPAHTVGKSVSRWLAKLQLASKGKSWVLTPSGARVHHVLKYAHEGNEFCVIHGGPGVGKTMAARQFTTNTPGAHIVTVDPTTSGLIPALEAVAEVLGLGDTSGGARRLGTLLCRRVEQASEPMLIVIDEAQHLSMVAIEALRAIHDRTGCGLVLMGNEYSYSRLVGGPRTAHYAQIRSRIGLRLRLSKPTHQDTDYVAAAWGVVDEACLKTLRALASRPGGLRIVSKVLLLCAQQGDITPTTLIGASHLYGAEV